MTVNQQQNLITVHSSYQKLLDRIPHLAWLMTNEGEIIAVNQQWRDYIGSCAADERRSWIFMESLHDEESAAFLSSWEQAKSLQTALNLNIKLQNSQGNWECFTLELDPDLDVLGQLIWIGTAIRVDREAANPGYQKLPFAQRLSEEADQGLTFQFLESLLAHASDGIVACDADGYTVLFNLAAQMFHGMLPKPIQAEDWAGFYDLYDRDGTRNLTKSEIPLFRALQGEVVVSQQMMIKSKKGGNRSLLANGTAIYSWTGEKLGAVVFMRDITAYKQAEIERLRVKFYNELAQQKLQERNVELDRFVSIVAHDLKAPLRAISSLSEWIEEDLQEQTPGENLQLQLLRQRVKRMDALIDGLLRYSRVGREDLVSETVDVAEVLIETIDSLSPPNSFKINIVSTMPVLHTKRLLLNQVFANLISNAIKHHKRVDGRIEIMAEDVGNHYRFSIADDGPGIPEGESRSRIFEIFQTLNPVQDSTENTGIGLALVKKIVTGEGGEIWLDHEYKQGCLFCFTWLKTATPR